MAKVGGYLAAKMARRSARKNAAKAPGQKVIQDKRRSEKIKRLTKIIAQALKEGNAWID